MSGEKEQVGHVHRFPGNLPHGEAGDDLRVPIQEHAVCKPGHKGQARAVQPQRGLAAPTVLDAQVGQGRVGHPAAQGRRVDLRRRFVVFFQKITFCIARPAIGKGQLLPAFLRLSQRGRQAAPQQRGHDASLDGGAVQHIGGRLPDEPLFPLRPARRSPLPHRQGPGGGKPLIAVPGTHPEPPGAGLLQQFQGPAAQRLVGQGRIGLGTDMEGADGNADHSSHTKILAFSGSIRYTIPAC